MPRKLRHRKTRRKKRARKPSNNMLKAPRRPVPPEVKRYFKMKKCPRLNSRSTSEPMETDFRLHVKADVPWELAAGIFGKHLQSHSCLKDKCVRYGDRVWVGSVLAVLEDGPGIRERLLQLGIKQSCYYRREKPKGDHLLFIKLPGKSVQWDQLPEVRELLAMVPDIISPKDISYFRGSRHPRMIYRLQGYELNNGTAVHPLLYEKSKHGRVLRPASEQDTGEVVAIYKIFVRNRELLGKIASVSHEELEALESQPDKLHILSADAMHHLRRLRHALAESASTVVKELKMAVGW